MVAHRHDAVDVGTLDDAAHGGVLHQIDAVAHGQPQAVAHEVNVVESDVVSHPLRQVDHEFKSIANGTIAIHLAAIVEGQDAVVVGG